METHDDNVLPMLCIETDMEERMSDERTLPMLSVPMEPVTATVLGKRVRDVKKVVTFSTDIVRAYKIPDAAIP